MALLPDTYVPCESCRGRRYNADTQAVLFKGKSVAEVLEMTIDEAREHLSAVGAIRRPLDFLSGIGLGYLALGQPSPTLSGGEAQRIKLAAELTSPGFGPSLYVLDEPTTGLHMADVAKLVDRAPAPRRPGRHRGRDRAQPRPDRGRRLRDRPRPRGRGEGRPGGGLGHAGAGGALEGLPHRALPAGPPAAAKAAEASEAWPEARAVGRTPRCYTALVIDGCVRCSKATPHRLRAPVGSRSRGSAHGRSDRTWPSGSPRSAAAPRWTRASLVSAWKRRGRTGRSGDPRRGRPGAGLPRVPGRGLVSRGTGGVSSSGRPGILEYLDWRPVEEAFTARCSRPRAATRPV